MVDARIELLRREIEMRRIEARTDAHHTAAMTQGNKILFWARWAVLVGVGVPILVALIAEIPFSKLLLSISSRPQSVSSQQAELDRHAVSNANANRVTVSNADSATDTLRGNHANSNTDEMATARAVIMYQPSRSLFQTPRPLCFALLCKAQPKLKRVFRY